MLYGAGGGVNVDERVAYACGLWRREMGRDRVSERMEGWRGGMVSALLDDGDIDENGAVMVRFRKDPKVLKCYIESELVRTVNYDIRPISTDFASIIFSHSHRRILAEWEQSLAYTLSSRRQRRCPSILSMTSGRGGLPFKGSKIAEHACRKS